MEIAGDDLQRGDEQRHPHRHGEHDARAAVGAVAQQVPGADRADDEAEETRWAIEIPKLSALILTHSWDGELRGLKAWPADQRPPAEIIFWTFRIMVTIGFAMVAIGLWSAWARWRRRLYNAPLLHRAAVAMGPSGFIAVLAGWITTEVGRQPWTIYGLLSTANSASPIAAPAVGASLLAFIVVYFAVFGAGTFYILRLMARRPDAGTDIGDIGPTRTAGITPGPAVRTGRMQPAE
jgi:cytochrome d ubiquinol oxidase subunit I